MRKKLLMTMLAGLAATTALAQFNGSGFYRVQNAKSGRYLAIVDNKSVGVSGTSVDVGLLHTWLETDDERVASSPATICWFEQKSTGNTFQVDVEGQGFKLSSVTNGIYLKVSKKSSPANSYTISGSQNNVGKYIADGPREDDLGDTVYELKAQATAGAGTYANWYIMPINQTDNYLGARADVYATADNSYWSTMYTSIALEPASTDTKAYVISRIAGDYAVLKEVTGVVPGFTPVLFRGTKATAKENKLKLSYSGGSSVGTNQLRGNWYCNDVDDSKTNWPHRNVTDYKPATMRMLGTDSEGHAAFVTADTADIKYLPANKAYLPVTEGTAATLRLVTEEELQAMGIRQLTVDDDATGAGSRHRGVYNMQGQRVAADAEEAARLKKGVYIVNGRKVVVNE